MFFKCTAKWIYNGGEVLNPLTLPGLTDGFVPPGEYNFVVRDPGGFDNCDNPLRTENELEKMVNIYNYPNPFSYFTNIRVPPIAAEYDFHVMTASGQEVYYEKVRVSNENYQIKFDGGGLENGIYIYSLNNDNFIAVQKMVIQR
ncbi:MAG: hypothetical protein DHS20C18_54700 [Saprospiraceae bacterium]|nr:MAG: hypothetical protein DHS20C18_54700 [Saprospiraceae bacterium]